MKKYLFNKIVSSICFLFIFSIFFIPAHFGLADIVCPKGTVINSDGNSCTSVYQLLAPLPGENGQLISDVNPEDGLGTYLNLMIKIFIGLCAVLSVVMIVVGGLEYMTSELSHSKEAGKEKIRDAIFGLLIALGAYALLYTINPDLLKSDITVPNTTPPASTR